MAAQRFPISGGTIALYLHYWYGISSYINQIESSYIDFTAGILGTAAIMQATL